MTKADTLEFIRNLIDNIMGYLRDDTNILEDAADLYDDDNNATYGALFCRIKDKLWEELQKEAKP